MRICTLACYGFQHWVSFSITWHLPVEMSTLTSDIVQVPVGIKIHVMFPNSENVTAGSCVSNLFL